MKLTGHSSEAAQRGYTHNELEVLKSAVSKLPSLNSFRAKSHFVFASEPPRSKCLGG